MQGQGAAVKLLITKAKKWGANGVPEDSQKRVGFLRYSQKLILFRR